MLSSAVRHSMLANSRGTGRRLPTNANLAFWFRKGTQIVTSGSAVTQWTDQSGLARNLLQATGSRQPTAQGDGTITFDGVNHCLKCSAFTLNQPTTVYLRVKQITYVSGDRLFDGDALGGGSVWQNATSPNLSLYAGSSAATVTTAPVGSWVSLAAVFAGGGSGTLQIGSDTQVGDPGAGNMGGLTLGAQGDLANPANIQVAELIGFSVAHAAATRAAFISYLDRL